MCSYWQLKEITKQTQIFIETDYYDGHLVKQRQMHQRPILVEFDVEHLISTYLLLHDSASLHLKYVMLKNHLNTVV